MEHSDGNMGDRGVSRPMAEMESGEHHHQMEGRGSAILSKRAYKRKL